MNPIRTPKDGNSMIVVAQHFEPKITEDATANLSVNILKNLKKEGRFKILSREKLMEEKSRHLPGSTKFCEIDRALRNSLMPFYIDQETSTKYHLLTGGLLGGGNYPGPDLSVDQERGKTATFSIDDETSITIEKAPNGAIIGELITQTGSIQSQNIILNDIPINQSFESDRKHLISLLQNRKSSSSLIAYYDPDNQAIVIISNSRPKMTNPLMLTGSEMGNTITTLNTKYSLIESLDEAYVDCALSPDETLESNINRFVKKYEGMLKQAVWDEERIDIMTRKATVEGLKINLIPSYRFDLLMSASSSIIQSFEAIEREIRLLNLSLDTQETLDFHMYRGFVYSKFPASMYPEQRKIAISDGMILIQCVDQLMRNERFHPTKVFCKKIAYAFKVFAVGMDNPPVSIKFIRLGLEFITKHNQLTQDKDNCLSPLMIILRKMEEESKNKMVKLDTAIDPMNIESENKNQRLILPQTICQSESIVDQFEKMEAMDQVLYPAIRDLENPQKNISSLKQSIDGLRELIRNERKSSQIFRMKLRLLFLQNYYNYFNNIEKPQKFVSKLKELVAEFDDLFRKIDPENIICLAEFYGFRGCVFITCPRFEKHTQYYDQAIKDLNKLNKIEILLHNDVRAFVYMTYGRHMLSYDPLDAVKLIRTTIDLSYSKALKLQAEEILNDFSRNFQPVRPCLQFRQNMIEFK